MLERLQKKWKVSGTRLVLILFTFAIGGSLTGYAGRKLMEILTIDQKWLWIILYLVIVILLWPIAVLFVSLLTGQFRFFVKYIKKIGARIGIGRSLEFRVRGSEPKFTTHIAIFASGAGSNTQKIIDHFRNNESIRIGLIVSNNPSAGVLKIAAKENIPSFIIEKEKFFRGNNYIDELKEKNIDLIVLAGFLWKLPPGLINDYPGRIINIHPALLPKYGGKGMYGNKVHAAVIGAGEKESGITIHYVDEQYDNGDIILQVKCPVLPDDTPDSLARRIHQLEHENYPTVIEEVLNKAIG
jgi:formyltetrahydrofolate-dependent phosphoribosylglycinamide formyltransferase